MTKGDHPARLLVRLDNAGDVLLAGPAIRALAADGPVDLLVGPAGAAAARLLPGVREIHVWRAPWILEHAHRGVAPDEIEELVDLLTGRHGEAAILTSFHQSPLPAALVLRLAGVERIAATSVDHPGALLDHRVSYRPELHEVEQQLLVAEALGAHPPADDDGALAVRPDLLTPPPDLEPGAVVVHADASVPARGIPPILLADALGRLVEAGHRIVLTGTEPGPLPGAEHGEHGAIEIVDLRGCTDWPTLAGVLASAAVVISGNTGPAHLAAAVGTPVVSIFAPVVAAHRWRPWRVPTVLLGDQGVPCAGCRARRCPLRGQPCVDVITGEDVLAAVDLLMRERPSDTASPSRPPALTTPIGPPTTRETV